MCLVAQSVQLVATRWTVDHQDLLCMGFSRQEYWSGLPFSSPRDLTDLRIEPYLLHCRLWLSSKEFGCHVGDLGLTPWVRKIP